MAKKKIKLLGNELKIFNMQNSVDTCISLIFVDEKDIFFHHKMSSELYLILDVMNELF